ncbi:MAG: ABC transporter substrate-binding protein [Planctomycetota bacterium]|nr:ABC transporter substrate-binding protein [Planctomycetota bacterium]
MASDTARPTFRRSARVPLLLGGALWLLAATLTGCGKAESGNASTGGSAASTKADATSEASASGGAADVGSAGNAVPASSSGSAGAIKVGHFASMTGSEATFGRSTDEGIRLAVKQINDAGGVKVGEQRSPVNVITEDTESKPEKAKDVVSKLVHRDKVVAVLGEVASSISLEGAPVCQRAGVPMITPSSTNTRVTQVGDFIFRVCFIDPFQGYAAAKFAREELKITRVALVVDNASAYSQELADEFTKALESMGGTIVERAEYVKGDKDFNARLTKIRQASPEAIYVPGYYQDVSNIAIQARQLGMTMPLMGGDGWDSVELGKNAGEAIEGCFYTNHYAPDDPNPEIQKFVSEYRAMFGDKTPDGLAALGYDAMRVLAQAIERAGTTEGKALRDAIAATKDFSGVTGTITINENRDAVKPIVIVERKGGQWVFRKRIEP